MKPENAQFSHCRQELKKSVGFLLRFCKLLKRNTSRRSSICNEIYFEFCSFAWDNWNDFSVGIISGGIRFEQLSLSFQLSGELFFQKGWTYRLSTILNLLLLLLQYRIECNTKSTTSLVPTFLCIRELNSSNYSIERF